jgi:hypothetical protein
VSTATDLNNLLVAAGESIDDAIEFTVTLATNILQIAKVVLLAKKAEFLGALKTWFGKTNGILKLFVIFIVAGIALTGVGLLEQFILTGTPIAASFAAAGVLTDVGKLTLYWNALKALWSVMVVLDERFQLLEQAWREILTTIDDIIGVPLNFISSIAASYHAYLTALYAMVGLPATDARITFVSNIAKWTQTLTTNITAFATKPGKIVDLLLGYAIKADPESASEVSFATISSVNTALTRIAGLNGNVQQLQQSFTRFIESFPDEIRDEAVEQTQAIMDFIEDKILPITEELSEIAETLTPYVSEMIRALTDPITADVEKVWDWIVKFKLLLGFDPAILNAQEEYLCEVMNSGILPAYIDRQTTSWLVQAAEQWQKDHEAKPTNAPQSSKVLPSVLRYPPIVTQDRNDWFVAIGTSAVGSKPEWKV